MVAFSTTFDGEYSRLQAVGSRHSADTSRPNFSFSLRCLCDLCIFCGENWLEKTHRRRRRGHRAGAENFNL